MDVTLECIDCLQPKNPCGECRRCKASCPGNAIRDDYQINSNRCVSYLTQKKYLTLQETDIMGNAIYGCDICQLVCPANRGVLRTDVSSEDFGLVDPRVDLKDILAISNADFKGTFGKTSAGWRGKRSLQRNAIVAMGNSKNVYWLPVLKEILETDSRQIILEEAERSIKKIEGMV